ncbi:FG-GAP-like repeat-containing protein [Streptomyces sp. SR27]|uniref:FG-GAP-like repeat-containing protein n=1 Tax=Streptomyces sp. SR27 TaxID=3076630 RepID=UPI00295AE888|nr:FG-GAP-like repeat-containing protein [Streptomyces sp. SR27]MDV9191779.1 FG-GAP-like repeat-containing protein [Streptomyces sp. SR27]
MRPSPSARLLRGALTAGLALGLSATALSSPARAADGAARCPQGVVCVFSQPLYQGDMLVVRSPMLSLGSWDNRIRSFVNNQSGVDAVCFYPEPGLDPEGSLFLYNSASFDESQYPGLDKTVSSVDIGPEADDSCGFESRYPMVYGDLRSRPAPLPATGAFGDINHDGYADVLARNRFGQLWSTRRQVGGGWNSMRDLAAAGDLTGDGKGDLLATDTAGVLWTYPGNGRGWFGSRVKVGGGWQVMNELVGAGDMNSDKRADLIARDTAGKLWLYPGDGKGRFGARKLIGTGGWNGHAELMGLGDVTGDGLPDLVAHAPATYDWEGHRYLRVYPGTGDGRLRAPVELGQLRPSSFVF